MRIAVVIATLLVSTSIAAAQAPGQTMSWEPDPTPPSAVVAQPQTVTVNYRKDVLLADGLSLALIIAAPVTDNEELAGWGVTGYFLAAPIVHIAHGRGVAAIESFGLRAGLPLFGAMLGYRLGPNDTACISSASTVEGDGWGGGDCRSEGSISGMLLGGLAGGVTAIVIDAKYLTKYEKRVSAPSWSASIKPTHGGVSLGVSGAF